MLKQQQLASYALVACVNHGQPVMPRCCLSVDTKLLKSRAHDTRVTVVQFDQAHAFKIHRERVRNMQPTVDTAPPEDFTHFQYNAKRAMQQAERLFEVERVRLGLCHLHV